MTTIETTRLHIVPLTLDQFHLLLTDMKQLEQELELVPSYESWNESTQKAMEYQYKKAVLEDPENLYWLTNWQIILKSENKSIGDINFKNIPDENGIVEIGYGIHSLYKNLGYMTDAVQALSIWGLNQKQAKQIIAETMKDNYASQKVLLKCGFNKYKETENSFWWKLEKPVTNI